MRILFCSAFGIQAEKHLGKLRLLGLLCLGWSSCYPGLEMLMLWLVTGAVIGTQSASASAWCGGLRRTGNDNSAHKALGNRDIFSLASGASWAPAHRLLFKVCPMPPISRAPKRTVLFLYENMKKVARVPVGKLWPAPESQQLGQVKYCPLPLDWESRAGRPLGSFAFFFFFKSIQWGVHWNSSVPFLLFVTNSHGSVFSVLFFFSVFKKKPPPGRGGTELAI